MKCFIHMIALAFVLLSGCSKRGMEFTTGSMEPTIPT